MIFFCMELFEYCFIEFIKLVLVILSFVVFYFVCMEDFVGSFWESRYNIRSYWEKCF